MESQIVVVSNFWPKDKGSGMAFYQELFAQALHTELHGDNMVSL